MATYEYRCPTCDSRYELRRPMSESSEPAVCPDGHPGGVRLLSVFASVGVGSSDSMMPSPGAMGGGCGPACACHPG